MVIISVTFFLIAFISINVAYFFQPEYICIKKFADAITDIENCYYFKNHLENMSSLLAQNNLSKDDMQNMDYNLYESYFSESMSLEAFKDASKDRFFTTFSFYLLQEHEISRRSSVKVRIKKQDNDTFLSNIQVNYTSTEGEIFPIERIILFRIQKRDEKFQISQLQIVGMQNGILTEPISK